MLDKDMDARYSWADCVDEDHLDLEMEVLRIGLPRETAHYHGIDEDPRTKFVVAHLGGKNGRLCYFANRPTGWCDLSD